MSCYIMQDDCLSPLLTVMEAMTVSANLKIGKNVSNSDKRAIVNEVLEILGEYFSLFYMFVLFQPVTLKIFF